MWISFHVGRSMKRIQVVREEDIHDMVISSPFSMSRDARTAMLTPALKNRT